MRFHAVLVATLACVIAESLKVPNFEDLNLCYAYMTGGCRIKVKKGGVTNIAKYINDVKDDAHFKKDQHIVCDAAEREGSFGTCLYFEDIKVPYMTGADAKRLFKELAKKCTNCGRHPVGKDGHEGYITVQQYGESNYCNGACKA